MKFQTKKKNRMEMNKQGSLAHSKDLGSTNGIKSGFTEPIGLKNTSLDLLRPRHLLKLYIEPTSQCNLNCRTCIRRTWNEPMGTMSEDVFDRVMEDIALISPKPIISFGGFGEPLSHPNIIEMITRVKKVCSHVELITNGTLLTEELSKKLIRAGLDILWVSIDGASPDSYADIRMGANLPKILENVAHFSNILKNDLAYNLCGVVPNAKTSLGIAFVAMKRNISDLQEILNLARKFGAHYFLVTNVLPYTKELCKEVLYRDILREVPPPSPDPRPILSMPLMDVSESTRDPLYWLMHYSKSVTWGGLKLRSSINRCPFIESGVGVIGWDGGFSPCLSLLHDHVSYYMDRERFSRRWIIGNVKEKSLSELWHDPEHISFRERVQKFDFAPCAYCGGCEMAKTNEEDCQGNEFPTCGGCLWAQGVIQCP